MRKQKLSNTKAQTTSLILAFVIAFIFLSSHPYTSLNFKRAYKMSEKPYVVVKRTYTLPNIASNRNTVKVETLVNTVSESDYTMYSIYRAVSKMKELYPNVESSLILAVIQKESQYNPKAYGSGATGLMQVIPSCHTSRIERLGVTDLYDIYSNILVGTDILSELIEKYKDVGLALMCYNMGEGTALYKYNSHGYSNYANTVLSIKEEIERSNDYGTNSRQEVASSDSGNS